MNTRLYLVLAASTGASGSICKTSYGFKLKYVEPGRSKRLICCSGVKTESLFSMALT